MPVCAQCNFLMVLWIGLQSVIVAFLGHIHLHFRRMLKAGYVTSHYIVIFVQGFELSCADDVTVYF